ncbi:MAG: efflux RND transporter periplasmic adaptor subunit [Pseudomonadota bacterium]
MHGLSRTRLLAAAFLAASLSTPIAAQQAPLPAVVVSPAEVSDLRDTLSFSGRLVASQKVDVTARVSGFLQEISFLEGTKVEAGAGLYQIEVDPYSAVVKQIEGSIAATQAELQLAEIERSRKETLVARETVAQSELDIAIANVGKVEGELARLEGELDRAKLDVTYTDITAPFDGIVGLSNHDVGAFVGPNSGPLTTLTRLDPMTVEFPIPSAAFTSYRQNNPDDQATGETDVSLILANGTTYSELGKLDFIDAQVARGTDTVIVRAAFANPNGVLLDGGLVIVELIGSEQQLVLNIPQQAVQRDQVGDFVLVVDDQSMVEQRRVVVQRTTKGRSVIAEGLDEGEVVITEGVNKVRPGIKVDAASATGG